MIPINNSSFIDKMFYRCNVKPVENKALTRFTDAISNKGVLSRFYCLSLTLLCLFHGQNYTIYCAISDNIHNILCFLLRETL